MIKDKNGNIYLNEHEKDIWFKEQVIRTLCNIENALSNIYDIISSKIEDERDTKDE